MSTEQKIIKNKIGLLRLAEELGNVSRASVNYVPDRSPEALGICLLDRGCLFAL
jgi:hypothetical protein